MSKLYSVCRASYLCTGDDRSQIMAIERASLFFLRLGDALVIERSHSPTNTQTSLWQVIKGALETELKNTQQINTIGLFWSIVSRFVIVPGLRMKTIFPKAQDDLSISNRRSDAKSIVLVPSEMKVPFTLVCVFIFRHSRCEQYINYYICIFECTSRSSIVLNAISPPAHFSGRIKIGHRIHNINLSLPKSSD